MFRMKKSLPRVWFGMEGRWAGNSLCLAAVVALTFFGSIEPVRCMSTELSRTAAALEKFCNDPPVIAELICQVQSPDPREADKNVSYFALLRHQRNGFYYREAPRLEDLKGTEVIPMYRMAGYYEDEYWDVSIDGRTLSVSTNGSASLKKAIEFAVCKASPVLNLGLFNSLPGSAKFEGYTLKSYTNYFDQIMDGVLTGGDGGRPATLMLSLKGRDALYAWEIEYRYPSERSATELVPFQVRGTCLHAGGQRTLGFDIKILSIELSDAPLPKQYFLPDLSAQNLMEIVHAPNGPLFREPKSTSLRPVATTEGRKGIRGVLTVFLGINLLMATGMIASWRYWGRAMKSERREHDTTE